MDLKNLLDYDLLLECIHCGLCLQSCPSYVVLGHEAESPRGRLFLMKAMEEGRLEPGTEVKKHLDLCLACRACETACPSGVKYHPILEAARFEIAKNVKPSTIGSFTSDLLLNEIFPSRSALDKTFSLLKFYQVSGIQKLVRKSGILGKFSKKLETAELFLPEVSGPVESNNGNSDYLPAKNGKKVGFLKGCIADYFFPAMNAATYEVFQKCGDEIVIPDEVHCCGAVHLHNGDRETAKQFARKNIDEFLINEVDIVVSNAAGCGSMMKEYPDLLADDPAYAEKAAKFSAMVEDISEYTAERLPKLELGRLEQSVVYDEPCHLLHAQKISEQPKKILESIPGLEVLPLVEGEMCCGSAGTFNILQPDLSMQVLERKMNNIVQSGANAVVTGNVGCMIQLKRGAELCNNEIQVYHLIELVAESLNNGM